jgi:hypothetical protein
MRQTKRTAEKKQVVAIFNKAYIVSNENMKDDRHVSKSTAINACVCTKKEAES